MLSPVQGDRSEALASGLGNRHPGSGAGADLAEVPVQVEKGGRSGFPDRFDPGPGNDLVSADVADVLRNPEDAVRIEAPEVGGYEVAGQDFRILRGRVTGREDV